MNTSTGCLESLQDFLNADSDSSDEDSDKAGDMKTGVACTFLYELFIHNYIAFIIISLFTSPDIQFL